MVHAEKIQWMHKWCAEKGLTLNLEGECGFGRECVGVLLGDCYPEYEWYDEKTWDRVDDNGDVWTPEDAYHKHPCVAVLGRGEGAESQLYDWLKWFDENNFKVQLRSSERTDLHMIDIMLGKHLTYRMVRQ